MADNSDMTILPAVPVSDSPRRPTAPLAIPLAVAGGSAGAAGQGPLSAEQLAQWAEANRAAQKVLRAAKVATFNGWTAGIFAALCLPFALLEFDLTSLVMAVGLGVVAWNEFRGRKLIRRFNLRGPRLLGWNQVGLLVLVIGYCLWQIRAGLTGPSPFHEALQGDPELGSQLAPFEQLYKSLALALYGGVIALTLLFQGLNAIYYFTRGRLMQAHLARTPAWIIAVQRSTAG